MTTRNSPRSTEPAPINVFPYLWAWMLIGAFVLASVVYAVVQQKQKPPQAPTKAKVHIEQKTP